MDVKELTCLVHTHVQFQFHVFAPSDTISFVMEGGKFSGQGVEVNLSSRNSEYSATLWFSVEKKEIFFGKSTHGHCHLTA